MGSDLDRAPVAEALWHIRAVARHPLPDFPLAALRATYDVARELDTPVADLPRPLGRPSALWSPYRDAAEEERASFRRSYARRRGKPGRTPEGLLFSPLVPVYMELRRYWNRVSGRKHPPLPLVIATVNHIDHRFGERTIENLHDRLRKSPE